MLYMIGSHHMIVIGTKGLDRGQDERESSTIIPVKIPSQIVRSNLSVKFQVKFPVNFPVTFPVNFDRG